MALFPDKPYDVFLSHGHIDVDIVVKIAERLADEADARVWLDRWVLIPGQHFQQEMAKGLEEAATCAVCIGDTTPAGWFREEIEKALNRQTRDPEFRVIPVILPNGNRSMIDNFLELRSWADFKNGILDAEAFHILTCGIRGVSPGRPPASSRLVDIEARFIREKLEEIRSLRAAGLISPDIDLEFQRKLVDRLVTRR
jgi:TIR domain